MGIVNHQGESGLGCPCAVIPPASLNTLSEGVGGGGGEKTPGSSISASA